jgi:putative DNA primase/helicase
MKRDANDLARDGGPEAVRQAFDNAVPFTDGAGAVEPPNGEPANGADAEPASAPAYSDEALALRFAQRHASDLRYVAELSKWLSWARTHWRADNTLHAFDHARQIIREAAKACKASKKASLIASAKTVAAVERLAKADRRLAATIEQWDDSPDLFNPEKKDVS